MVDLDKMWNVSKKVMQYTNPLVYAVAEATGVIIKNVNNGGSIIDLQQESIRQELLMRIAEHQARVAQEISIARRIDTAEEVTIEEFYDVSGEANAGVKAQGEGLSAGISGSGRKVTKRVYTFKGWRDGVFDAIANQEDL